jgi:hypothetical protein
MSSGRSDTPSKSEHSSLSTNAEKTKGKNLVTLVQFEYKLNKRKLNNLFY